MKTTTDVKCAYNSPEKWVILDAKGKTLGRLASLVAHRLRGKHLPEFAPNVDCGDHVIIINAAQIKVSGNKADDKTYWRHTGYPGGIRQENFASLIKRNPVKVFELAVKGMLPRGPLGYRMHKKLKVYATDQHPHAAQQPESINEEV